MVLVARLHRHGSVTAELVNSAIETLFRGLDEENGERAARAWTSPPAPCCWPASPPASSATLIFLSRLIEMCAPPLPRVDGNSLPIRTLSRSRTLVRLLHSRAAETDLGIDSGGIMGADASVLNWLTTHHADLVRDLAELVAIPSISTDGEHPKEIEQTAELTCEQMRAGRLAERRHPADAAVPIPTPTANGSAPPASRRSSSMPITTCSRSITGQRMAVAAVDADAARRPAVRPRRRRRQGGHHRPTRPPSPPG